MKTPERWRAAAWNIPVGWQLSLVYALLLVSALVLTGAALYTQLERFLTQNTATRLHQSASVILQRAQATPPSAAGVPKTSSSPPAKDDRPAPAPPTPDPERLSADLVRGLSGPEVWVAVYDLQGAVIAASQPLDETDPRRAPDLPANWIIPAMNRPNERILVDANGATWLVAFDPFTAPIGADRPPARFILAQTATLAPAKAILDQLRLYLGLGILVSAVVGVALGLGLTRVILRPLDQMVRTAEAIAAGDLGRRLRLPSGRNEVARLGAAFDHMVDQLATTLEAQRRFVADASHELRTPLTSLEGLSEMLLLGADRGDGQVVQRIARSMYGELRRLGRLVSDLLTLSRLDSATLLTRERLDVGLVLAEVAEQMGPVAEAREVQLTIDRAVPVVAAIDHDRLKQVILNLVDNAVRYSPTGGEVRLASRLDADQQHVLLTVKDNGPGLTAEDIPHLFERFYRGDRSRARATGNTGLGLAIAHAIVEAHGGSIGVESMPGQGATFTVRLPLDEPPI